MFTATSLKRLKDWRSQPRLLSTVTHGSASPCRRSPQKTHQRDVFSKTERRELVARPPWLPLALPDPAAAWPDRAAEARSQEINTLRHGQACSSSGSSPEIKHPLACCGQLANLCLPTGLAGWTHVAVSALLPVQAPRRLPEPGAGAAVTSCSQHSTSRGYLLLSPEMRTATVEVTSLAGQLRLPGAKNKLGQQQNHSHSQSASHACTPASVAPARSTCICPACACKKHTAGLKGVRVGVRVGVQVGVEGLQILRSIRAPMLMQL